MTTIKIKNLGPIKSGFEANDGFMKLRKVTIFIGNQGSGKSTITKLISTLTWLEKSLIRGNLQVKDLTTYNRFKNKHCGYQNISNYFREDTEIIYKGVAYTFTYKDGNFGVEPCFENQNHYIVPKIMYIPAERNLISVVDKPDKLKFLPKTLLSFLDEYITAANSIREPLRLPIHETDFEWDKWNKIAHIKGKDYKVRLSEASSGFQSVVPLYLVSKNLAASIHADRENELSLEEEKRLKAEITKILSNPKLSEEVKKNALEVLSNQFRNARFINIVEEPEQNLYPATQKAILFELLKFANQYPENQLMITTHSPYIINYLTLAIKGAGVLEKIKVSAKESVLKVQLEAILPMESCIAAENALVYELMEDGSIQTLSTYKGLPSDDNFLNRILAEGNDLFANLLEIEAKAYSLIY
jgi:predicted ATPase